MTASGLPPPDQKTAVLNAAQSKLANLNRASADGRPQSVALGMPTFTDAPARR
ncbi:hypothetical protein GCM10023196_022780 [Actinoallomurus vinaceus]|uniref:Uncharacterized protein n=1 Tax=Actinoallomurus vinaceus TaxID=1080074 RepID=A0ABP8U6Y3_9ACTN